MLTIKCDLLRLFLIEEACDEFVIKHIELQEAIVNNLVLDLEVEEAEGLQAFDDLTEGR